VTLGTRTPAAPAPASAIELHAASELLRALSAPHRLAIVLELAEGTRCVHELVESLGISQSLTSQHLRVLRTGGLVAGVRRGKEMAYSLADAHVAHIARDALTHGSEPRPKVRERSATRHDAPHGSSIKLKTNRKEPQ
jgi:ArsR family transcriptional regulator, zinc-responsive transcriptional repressor